MSKKENEAIVAISKIRARNNLAWMSILALAVKARPRKTKEIIRKIAENDRKITKWLGRV